MSDRLDQLDYYTLLGVTNTVTGDALRAAFHTFALKFHPDNHGGSDQIGRATKIFSRGTEAYRVLKNPQKRQAYDAALQNGALRLREEQSPAKAKRKAPMHARARPFFRKAQKAHKAGQPQQAKLSLGIALGHDPDHPDLLALKSSLDSA